jgi:hypothetical protein
MTGGWEGISKWPTSRYYYGVRAETEGVGKYSGSLRGAVSEQRDV